MPPAGPPPPGRGQLLFEVPFASVLSDGDLALLADRLELSTRVGPATAPGADAARRQDAPGFARLDHSSGLFLKRGAADDEWLLEARTWGRPAADTVHEWHVLAAGGARMLDPSVILPERLAPAAYTFALHPVGRAANKRSARWGRRLLRLPG